MQVGDKARVILQDDPYRGRIGRVILAPGSNPRFFVVQFNDGKKRAYLINDVEVIR